MSCHPTRSAAHRAASNRARRNPDTVYTVCWLRTGYEVRADSMAGLQRDSDGLYLMIPAHRGYDVQAAFYWDSQTRRMLVSENL